MTVPLTKSRKLGEDVYKKEVFYIDTKGLNDSLYSDLPEFRSSLSRELSNKIVDNLDSLLERENEEEKGKPKIRKNSGIIKILNGNQKLRKPVISFFSDKAKVLKEEIEKINRDAEERKRIHAEVIDFIQTDFREVKRLLHEISLYAPGTKHSIDLRRLDLERETLGLRKEVRMSQLSLWRDLVFLRRELREILFEYSAIKRLSQLVENGGRA